jgi:hypothetical protein
MNKYQKILTIVALIAFGAIATSASAMIGQTPEEVIQGARRDKDTLAIHNQDLGGLPELKVDYKDGSFIRHTFGASGREIAFHVQSVKRFSPEDVFRIQRMYRTAWRGLGTEAGLYQWLSASGLQMFAERHEAFDILTIFDLNHSAEIQSAIARSAAPAPVAPPTPVPAIGSEEPDCLIVATKKYWELKQAGCWVRIARFTITEKGNALGGHAVVIYQPMPSTGVYYYDKYFGSVDLHTQSHDLAQITAAVNQFFASLYNFQSPEWIGL